MTLGELLTEKERKDLIGYVRLAAISMPCQTADLLLVELEREAIVLCNGAAMIGDPDGKHPSEVSWSMGQLILKARDGNWEEWLAVVSNAHRAHTTGELPTRWTVYP